MMKNTKEDKTINEKVLPLQIRKEISEAIKKCYACSKCTSGCPVAGQMGFGPALLVRWLLVGDIEKIIKSKSIWVCSSCQNCYSRCPFEINIPHIIDLLKEQAQSKGIAGKERPTRLFHQIFLFNIKRFGRIHEASFIGIWKALSGKWFSDLGLGAKMFVKGKLPLFPEKIKYQKDVEKLFKTKTKPR
ncbi:MAG: 4Fe-4S dicluster domain-containing protein [Omnitrophica bacterium]|nr:4Fe-4S dicluster domain-containing protein [Candidatus Omnitrophota bacterium]